MKAPCAGWRKPLPRVDEQIVTKVVANENYPIACQGPWVLLNSLYTSWRVGRVRSDYFCVEVSVAENESNKAAGSDKRKQSLYFPESMLQEIKDEAARLDRSLSWVVQRAWKMARLEIKKIPSVNDVEDEPEAES